MFPSSVFSFIDSPSSATMSSVFSNASSAAWSSVVAQSHSGNKIQDVDHS
jgi:hypothetical protein